MSNFSDLKKRNLLSMELMSKTMGGRVAAVAEWDPRGDGTCGFKTNTGWVQCGVSKEVALAMIEDGGYWCCDSCASSSYCG